MQPLRLLLEFHRGPDLVGDARRRAGRVLTQEERETYRVPSAD